MTTLFYIVGWLTILVGLGTGGYSLYNAITAANISITENFGAFATFFVQSGMYFAVPGLWLVFWGMLILAVGGVLSRLDEIAYNTRAMN